MDTQIRLWHLIGGNAQAFLAILAKHVVRYEPNYPASWVVSWVAMTMLAGLAAWTAAVFRVSREHGRPLTRSIGESARPKPVCAGGTC